MRRGRATAPWAEFSPIAKAKASEISLIAKIWYSPMPLLFATIRGDLRAAMEAEIRDVARAMRRGVERAGREVQAELRAQARGAGFSDKGRALANSWRLKLYPPPGAAPRSFRPAALVYSNAPKLPALIRAGHPGQRSSSRSSLPAARAASARSSRPWPSSCQCPNHPAGGSPPALRGDRKSGRTVA